MSGRKSSASASSPPSKPSAIPARFDRAIEDLIGAVCDPIIVYPGGWGDTVPDWMKKEAKLQRIIHEALVNQGKEERELATDIEALIYLYTVHLCRPPDHEWFRIHMWLTKQAFKGKPAEKTIAGLDCPEKLDDCEIGLLKDLKRWIWRKREEARKARRKGLIEDRWEQMELPLKEKSHDNPAR